jgi:hypothetical protein
MRKTIRSLLLLSLLCHAAGGSAQRSEKKTPRVKWGIEAGSDLFFGTTAKPDQVRGNPSSFDWFYDPDAYHTLIWNFRAIDIDYFGFRVEKFSANNRTGLATGLRFSKYATTLDSGWDYFLWRTRQDGLHTEYTRIRHIRQNGFFAGIPVELKFFPNRRDLPVRFYFKTGAILNLRLYTDYKIDFQDPTMEIHASTIRQQSNQRLKNLNAYLFLGCGLKIGRTHTDGRKYIPHVLLELRALNLMLLHGATSYAQAEAGTGLHLTFQIPLGKNPNP